MEISRQLERIGLTEKEIKVYLAALQLGQFTMSEIAQKAGIKRPTCYLIIDGLHDKGLITKTLHGSRTRYLAELPTRLIHQLQVQIDEIKELTPLLEKMQKKKSEARIRIFRDRKGIQSIYEDMLRLSNKTIYGIFSHKILKELSSDSYLKLWGRHRVNKNISVSNLLQRSQMSEEEYPGYARSEEQLRDSAWLHEDVNFPASIGIYDNKVAFVPEREGDVGFIITSDGFSATLKQIFLALKKYASETL